MLHLHLIKKQINKEIVSPRIAEEHCIQALCHETEWPLNKMAKLGDVRKAELTNLHANLKQFSDV